MHSDDAAYREEGMITDDYEPQETMSPVLLMEMNASLEDIRLAKRLGPPKGITKEWAAELEKRVRETYAELDADLKRHPRSHPHISETLPKERLPAEPGRVPTVSELVGRCIHYLRKRNTEVTVELLMYHCVESETSVRTALKTLVDDAQITESEYQKYLGG